MGGPGGVAPGVPQRVTTPGGNQGGTPGTLGGTLDGFTYWTYMFSIGPQSVFYNRGYLGPENRQQTNTTHTTKPTTNRPQAMHKPWPEPRPPASPPGPRSTNAPRGAGGERTGAHLSIWGLGVRLVGAAPAMVCAWLVVGLWSVCGGFVVGLWSVLWSLVAPVVEQ